MMRGDLVGLHRLGSNSPGPAPNGVIDSYGEAIEFDRFREYPVEGPDSYGAIPEDLVANRRARPISLTEIQRLSLLLQAPEATQAAAPTPSFAGESVPKASE